MDLDTLKKRFDDAYRSMLVIVGIYAFAFTNYASEPFTSFIYFLAFPFLITAVVIWASAHLLNRPWEYRAKYVGFILTWFSTLGVFFIVYTKGLGTIYGVAWWIILNIGWTLAITWFIGDTFERNGISTRRYKILMMAFALLLGLITIYLLQLHP